MVEIAPDGEVVYRQRVWGSFSQPLTLHDFPLDRQRFDIRFATAGYSPKEIRVVQDPDRPSGIASAFSLADWKILGWRAETNTYIPVPGQQGTAGFVLWFEAKRYVGYYVFKIIVPLLLIVAMSWIVFWVEPEEFGTQISVAITAMLTLIAYRFMVGDSLPKISYLTRMDFFILGSTVLVFATLVEALLTSMLAKHDRLESARSIDQWARYGFPSIFIVWILMAFFL